MNDSERMQFFLEMFHSSLPRLGPGSDTSTYRALEVVLGAKPRDMTGASWPRVLDLGCGTGPQSIALARRLGGTIMAIDIHQPNLDALRRRAEAAGVAGKIRPVLQDMRTFDPGEAAFDLIWSEGAMFCMGFLEGLDQCRPWLAPDGFLVLTELCWTRPDIPAECREYIEGQYPVIADVDTNLGAIKARGYRVLDHFILPESDWLDEFYNLLEKRLQTLRPQCAGDDEKMGMIAHVQAEIDNYRKYSAYYGYVCCVLQRS